MKDKRPVNLDLTTIRFPIPAIASILHRLSGVLLFLLIPLLLWMLQESLASAERFSALHDIITSPLSRFSLWILLSALIYHFVAGIRHLLMDVHIGDGLKSGRTGAVLTIAISAILIILTGIWLC